MQQAAVCEPDRCTWHATGAPLLTAPRLSQVLRMLGNGRLEAQCIDGTKRLCHIRGKMRKKVTVVQ
jgi:hypothetical protein